MQLGSSYFLYYNTPCRNFLFSIVYQMNDGESGVLNAEIHVLKTTVIKVHTHTHNLFRGFRQSRL